MKEKYNNIFITSYESKDSLAFHLNYDVVLVPSIGSEGTSLSLLEAMSAGCYCIASNIGGLTDIIIDNYNGKLVQPNIDDFYEAVVNVISKDEHDLLIKQLHNAYSVVNESFSFEMWEKRWLKTLQRF